MATLRNQLVPRCCRLKIVCGYISSGAVQNKIRTMHCWPLVTKRSISIHGSSNTNVENFHVKGVHTKTETSGTELSERVKTMIARRNYRFAFPEFLPDADPLYRNPIRERLERSDMLKRREQVEIPEFYVGSIVAVTLADPNAVKDGKTRFVGMVIDRGGTGLRAWAIVRNIIDGQGVEIRYDIYSPNIIHIETLRLELRLDDELYYLRDAPQEYSSIPVDMEPELLPEGEPVPLNPLVVPLASPPWHRHWERFAASGLVKGFSYDWDSQLTDRQKKKLEVYEGTMMDGWQLKVTAKYDLMRQYRNTIPLEEQDKIWQEVGDVLEKRDREMKRAAARRQIAKSAKK